MGSSPIWLWVIHEHGFGKAVQTFPWPSVPELGVLITLEPGTVEHLLSSRPRSGVPIGNDSSRPRPIYLLPFHHFPSIPHFISIICTNKPSTLDPGCADTIVPPYSHPESNCSSPGQVFLRPYLFITLCSHTARLVCQRMLFLMLLSQTLAAQTG
jgi:hypothetical protein